MEEHQIVLRLHIGKTGLSLGSHRQILRRSIYDRKCDPAHVSYVDVDAATFAECRAHKGDFYVLRGNGNRNYVATGGHLSVEPDPPCIFPTNLRRSRCRNGIRARLM